MVNRVKTWTPPSIPLRDNLPAWKAICNDISNHMILAGLVQTSDSGQLDIDAVSALPVDGAWSGYRMYRFNDLMQSQYPIFIKLEFGCGYEGLTLGNSSHRSRTINIVVSVGLATDGAGNFTSISSVRTAMPQSSIGGTATVFITTQLTSTGTSYISYNEDKGFFGFVYGAGSRNKPFSNATSGAYYGSSFALFVQRTLDGNGNPDNRGVSVLCPRLQYTSNSGNPWVAGTVMTPNPITHYILTDTAVENNILMPVIGMTGSRLYGTEAGLQPIYTATPYIETWPSILLYFHSDITVNTVINPNFNGSTFKTMGRETGIIPNNANYSFNGIAMLYEGDVIP